MNTLKDKIVTEFNLQEDLEKQKAIFDVDGPTLIIAGPGAGKTYTLVLRALYLLLSGKAKSSEIILASYTEKSALELRDRFVSFTRQLGEKINYNEMILGTIHSICEHYVTQFIKNTPLTKNYVILDDITNLLFLNEHWIEIGEPFKNNGKYFGRWILWYKNREI